MGSQTSQVDQLITGYVDPIPVLPPSVDDGKKTTEYFYNKHKFTDVSLFSGERFNRKNSEVAGSVS